MTDYKDELTWALLEYGGMCTVAVEATDGDKHYKEAYAKLDQLVKRKEKEARIDELERTASHADIASPQGLMFYVEDRKAELENL